MGGKDRRKQDAEAPPSQMRALPLDVGLFSPGDRVCVAVSGGADSTALMRTLLAKRAELGIVLSVLHVEHGLRGEASAHDAAFVASLAKEWELPFEMVRVDTPRRVAEQKESIEEAARNLRYEVFRAVLAAGKTDKIATAHTLDDQAETVLMKLLRGAWTEGLSGIHPVLRMESTANTGGVTRPLLDVRRQEIEAYLRGLNQAWCEDETNQSALYTRNRVRHELMPMLRTYNPQIEQALAHVAANARAEEQHWQAELVRLLPQLVREGKPVRGGGRSVSTEPGSVTLALELARLRALDAGLRRRVLRATVERCGATLDFSATERLMHMVEFRAVRGADSRMELPGGVRVECSVREMQFTSCQQRGMRERGRKVTSNSPIQLSAASVPVYELQIPGTVEAPAFRARYTATVESDGPQTHSELPSCWVRAWQPGDRVMLRYSSGPKKVKEVLERMGIRGEDRSPWPVIEWHGTVVWMRGVELAALEGGPMSNGKKLHLNFIETRMDAEE